MSRYGLVGTAGAAVAVVVAASVAGAASAGASAGGAGTVAASPAASLPAPSPSDTGLLRRQALDRAYGMDYDDGLALARQAVAADPGDPANHLALASIAWLSMLAARGALMVEEYLGPPPRGDLRRAPPPSDLAVTFRHAVANAAALASRRVHQQPHDLDAAFAAGAAEAWLAAYLASEEGRIFAALGAARRAYGAHSRVSSSDQRRGDTGLVLGTFRYAVATLSVFKRWLAYLAGFGGDKARAFELLEACAAWPSDVQTEARFALVVFYTREGRLQDALRELAVLREQYPRNRLLRLETGSMLVRAGRPAEALEWFDRGLASLAGDPRWGMFGELAVWHYQRGLAFVALGRPADAAREATAALGAPSRVWLRGRAFVLQGYARDLSGDRPGAVRAYRQGAEIGRSVGDALGVQEAERWFDKPFGGTSPSGGRHTQ